MATKSHVVEELRIETHRRHREFVAGYREVHRTTFPVARGSNQFSGDCSISHRLSESQAHTYMRKKPIMPLPCAASHAMTNNRNVLYLIIGVLVVALASSATTCIRPRRNRKACRSMSPERAEDPEQVIIPTNGGHDNLTRKVRLCPASRLTLAPPRAVHCRVRTTLREHLAPAMT